MFFLLGIFLNQLVAEAARENRKITTNMNSDDLNKATTKMGLDLKRDCTWTRKPGKESMPAYPTFESDHLPECFVQCFDTFHVYVDVWDHVDYTDTGRTEPGKSGTFDKVCKVPGGPQAPYLCGHKRFDCAIHMYNKEESDEDEGLDDTFPQSCVADGWGGASEKLGAGPVPNSRATLALYAYSNYEANLKGSRRTIAYQVRFEDVDDAYDGMCQGIPELEPDSKPLFGVHAGKGLKTEDAVAPLALPGVLKGSWPTPPFHPTPKEKPKTLPKKIDDKGKDKNGEGSKVTPKTMDDKGKDKNGGGSKVTPKTIDGKGKDKNGEGSGVPWVPVLICLALLSAAAAAFQVRRSRRMAQFADGAY